MSKKKMKKSHKRALKWIVASLVFLVLLIGIGIYELVTDADYKVSSRTSILAKRQKNDTSEKKTVGWLRVQGTNIDYPVLYAPDYNFIYETEDFAWTEADFKKLNNIVYISGHNIKNLSLNPLITNKNHSRFEQLMSFIYYDFAKENQFIQYTFNDKNYVYRMVAVACYEGSDIDLYNNKEYSSEQLLNFVNNMKEMSMYEYNADFDENDKYIVLDTCTNFYGASNNIHFVVVGRMIREKEKMKKVKVEKTEEYKDIEMQMKGGDSDDEA